MTTQAQRDKIAELNQRFPKESYRDGYAVLRDAGFCNETPHGGIDPVFLRPSRISGDVKPEGFCVLENGKVGFCDYYGTTYEAPDEWQV